MHQASKGLHAEQGGRGSVLSSVNLATAQRSDAELHPSEDTGAIAGPGQVAERAGGAAGGTGSGRRREGAGQALRSRPMASPVRSYSLVVRGDSWLVRELNCATILQVGRDAGSPERVAGCNPMPGAALRPSPTPRERRPSRRTGASLIDLRGPVSSYLDRECLDRLATSTPYYDLWLPSSSDFRLWG
jgi:hypothetical protein